jgi:hypothetical protein
VSVKACILDERAEQQPGSGRAALAPLTEEIGQPREFASNSFHTLLRCLEHAKDLRLREHGAQLCEALGLEHVIERQGVNLLDCVREIGVDFDPAMSDTTRSDGFCRDSRYWSSCWYALPRSACFPL